MHAPGHTLPSSSLLAQFTGFFKRATVEPNGSCTVVLTLPAESALALMDLAEGDGMALNFDVYKTDLPDDMQLLAKAIGMDITPPLTGNERRGSRATPKVRKVVGEGAEAT